LPYTYFLYFPKISPSKGQLTTFFHEGSGRVLIKQILGVESDVVASTGEALYLNGMNVGKIFKNDTHGQKLTPLKSQVIPRGNVFLYAPHPRSFDSRYAEVGLVPLPKLQGRVVGIV
jgi:conjugal transfer pilin signal peptidase TrbI